MPSLSPIEGTGGMIQGLAPSYRGLGGHVPGRFGPQRPGGARPWPPGLVVLVLFQAQDQINSLDAEGKTAIQAATRGDRGGNLYLQHEASHDPAYAAQSDRRCLSV